jgi:hypothetical protein
MCPVIRVSDELFARLESYAIGFDTPSAVIERFLDNYENIDRNCNEADSTQTIHIPVSMRTNPKPFLSKNFPELLHYKIITSRMYENKDKISFKDNWWFNFGLDSLHSNEFIIFVGALDLTNEKFRIFKVPTSYLLQNIDKIDKTNKGWINIYIHMKDLIDLRNNNHLSFRDFAIN